jgi:RNA polymerase sigma-70 factor, ECF subfamily
MPVSDRLPAAPRSPAAPGGARLAVIDGTVTGDQLAESDAELIERIVAGDQSAFAAVYDRHVDVVYGSVVRFLRDREGAEEVVQDAYLAVWRHAEQYMPDAGSLLGWLLRIARNKAIDRTRAAARRPRLVDLGEPEDDLEGRLDRVLATRRRVESMSEIDPGPEEAATRAWARAVVRSALTAMPGPEREALELAYDDGLTQVEIAERLGWPLGTVKTRTRRGLASLRAALDGVPELVGETPAGPGVPGAVVAFRSSRIGGIDAPR